MKILENIFKKTYIITDYLSDVIPRNILNPRKHVYSTGPDLGNFDTLATFSNNVIKKFLYYQITEH